MSTRPDDRTDETTEDRTEMYDAMSHPHRRWAVDAVETCGALDLQGVVAHVLRREGLTGEDSRQNVAVGLYHVHLPKLDDAEFVEFDRDEQTVAPGDRITPATARFESGTAALSD
ncbi:hypothetical protein ACFPYI_01155 [Halomarina salina]|uniref:DUF7344 domain-containing protein n=1 Tax=Halomarina salina TaxID=1872699 RepID=A0ABD5RHZ8_9EURY|nr:hypothetical protein [Halomarina salina]